MKYRQKGVVRVYSMIWTVTMLIHVSICNTSSTTQTFGFRTCKESVDSSAGSASPFTLNYQWEHDRYECTIREAPKLDTAYTCKTQAIGDANSRDNFIQINIRGNDDVCVSAIIVNGIEISVKPQRLGDNANSVAGPDKSERNKKVYKRRYNVDGGKAVMTLPDGFDDYRYYVRITSCDGWSYPSTSNSLSMQFTDSTGTTEWATINKYGVLPSGSGEVSHSEMYPVDASLVGMPISIKMKVADPNGYCLKSVDLFPDGIDSEDIAYGEDYFGSGVILSSECKHSFREYSSSQPLVQCFEHPFEFWTNKPRDIHTIDIHTCAGEHSGAHSKNMKKNLFLEMVGKETNDSDSYTTTDRIYLDHFVPGHVNLEGIGHLVASNVFIDKTKLFIQDIEDAAGEAFLGIKIEVVDYEEKSISNPTDVVYKYPSCKDDGSNCLPNGKNLIKGAVYDVSDGYCYRALTGCMGCLEPKYRVKSTTNGKLEKFEGPCKGLSLKKSDDNTDFVIFSQRKFDNGRYMIAFVKQNEYKSDDRDGVFIRWSDLGQIRVNIYFIFAEFEKLYQMPFIAEPLGQTADWFSANKACNDAYGTGLASIHSADENFLAIGFGAIHRVTKKHTEKFTEDQSQCGNGKEFDAGLCYPYCKSGYYGVLAFCWSYCKKGYDDHGATCYKGIFDFYFKKSYGRGVGKLPTHPADVVTEKTWEEIVKKGSDRWIGFGVSPYQKDRDGEDVWTWADGSNSADYTNWAPGNPNNHKNQQKCVQLDESISYQWNDASCKKELPYICSSPYWPADTERTFEVNIADTRMFEIDVVTLSNLGSDDMCFDSMAIDGEQIPSLISTSGSNWIAIDQESTTLSGVIKYPICHVEVIDTRLDLEATMQHAENVEKTISGLQCMNKNRLIPSTCSVQQSYQMAESVSLGISMEEAKTRDISWSKATTVGFSFMAHSKLEVALGGDTAKATAGVQLTHTESNQNTLGGKSGTSVKNGKSEKFETSKTVKIDCSGKMTVPASHSVQYSLQFQSTNDSVRQLMDLKYTLCSAYLPNVNANDTFRIVRNVPSYISADRTTSCSVQFEPAEYIPNKMSCAEEADLAWSLLPSSPFIPKCQSENPALYDGCQCDSGVANQHSRTQCYCSDEFGDMIDGRTAYVDDRGDNLEDRARVCVEELKCENTEYEYDASPAAKVVSNNYDDNPNEIESLLQHEVKAVEKTNNALMTGLAVLATFNVVVMIGCILCCVLKKRGGSKGYVDVVRYDEDEEQQKLEV